MSPQGSIVLPSDSDGPPFVSAGLRELSTPRMHSTDVTARLVSSYLTFSPLPAEAGGYFLLHDLTLTDYFPLRSGVPYVARTFLPPFYKRPATDCPTAFMRQK